MSRATKRKHVLREILEDDYSPPGENQQIVKVISSRGNNLHEVKTADDTTFLASMPTKFRKNMWVKRGDFVLVEPIEEGDKVKAEMVRVLTSDHIKYFKQDGVWPAAFDDPKEKKKDDDDLFVNTNRLRIGGGEDNSDSSGSDTETHSDSDTEESDSGNDTERAENGA